MKVPTEFADATIIREGEAGRRWVAALPALAEEYLDRWDCTPTGQVRHGFVGVVVFATRAGAEVALKLGYPRGGAEAVALSAWNGDGAARLLEHDGSVLLLERLRPLEQPVPAPITAVGLLARQLAVPAPAGLASLAEKLRAWEVEVPAHAARLGSPLPRRVVDACVANVRELLDQPALLVHGDLHFGNILCGDGLKAIDPTGLVGDPAFELLPVLRGDWGAVAASGDVRRAVEHRVAEFAEAAGVDRERVRRWTQARAAESALWGRQLREPAWVVEIVDEVAALLVA